MTNPIRNLLKARLDAKQDTLTGQPGLLGNSAGVVNITGRTGYVYVRVVGQPIAEVFNNRVPAVADLPVIVGYDPLQPGLYQVLSSRVIEGITNSSTGTSALGVHGGTHSWMASDPVSIDLRQFLPLRVAPAGGMLIYVYRGAWKSGDTVGIYESASTYDLTAHKPAAGKCCWVLVTLTTTGTVVTTKGAEVATASFAFSDIPAAPAGTLYALAAVRLYGAMTAIVEAKTSTDILDLRFTGGSGGTTGGSITLAASADVLLGLSGDTLSLDTQSANLVLAGPASGVAAAPTFRALVSGDIPADAALAHDYLFSSFKYTEENGLYILSSPDAATWTLVGGGKVYSPASGYFRDPSIIRYKGKYYVVYTHPTNTYLNGYPGHDFQVIQSTDLVNWTLVATVDLVSLGADHVWAPEWFLDYDGTLHVFVAVSLDSGSTFHIYETHPTNTALTSWSTATHVTFSSGEPTTLIDACMVKKDGKYYFWYKEEGADYIEYAQSTSLTSGFTKVQTGDWAGWGHFEGPCLVQLYDGTWRIYFDHGVTIECVYYSDSTDDWATWTTPVKISPAIYNQGTVIRRAGVHGELSGLSQDDHSQYLTTARHDLTARHALGTVVPHDVHASLTGLDVDASTSAVHHTLGTGANQAAAGDHTHADMTALEALMAEGQTNATVLTDDADTDWLYGG